MFRVQLFLFLLAFTDASFGILTNNPNPLDYINQLQQRLDNYLYLLNFRLPEIVSNLNSNIDKISRSSNIPGIIASAQSHIGAYSSCSIAANSMLESVSVNARSSATECVSDAITKAGNITSQIIILVQKANYVKSEITTSVEKCVKQNIANGLTLALCLLANVQQIEELVQSLGNEVEMTVQIGEQLAQDIGITLGACILDLDRLTIEKSNEVIRTYDYCINFENS